MPAPAEYPDDWDDGDDWEGDGDDASSTISCSECGADVYEDAVVCPVCNEYVRHGTRLFTGRPIWFICLALLGILALLWMLIAAAAN